MVLSQLNNRLGFINPGLTLAGNIFLVDVLLPYFFFLSEAYYVHECCCCEGRSVEKTKENNGNRQLSS